MCFEHISYLAKMSYLQYALYYVIFIVLPLSMHKGVSIPLYRISSYLMHCHFPRIRYLQRDLLKTERSTSDMGRGLPTTYTCTMAWEKFQPQIPVSHSLHQ